MKRALLFSAMHMLFAPDAPPGTGGAAAAIVGAGDGAGAGGGTPAATDWRASLPDDLKAAPAFANIKSVEDLAKEHINLQGLIGRKGLILPKDDAPQSEWDKFFDGAGRPKEPAGYEFKKPTDFEAYSDDFAKDFRDFAHKNGLNTRQAAALHDWWVGKSKGQFEGELAKGTEAKQKVQQDIAANWGAKATEQLALAKRGATLLGFDQETIDGIEAFGGQGGFKVLQGLAKFGELMREGTIKGGGVQNGLSPADAKAELLKIAAQISDPKSPLMDKAHPEHNALLQRQLELQRIAAGQSAASGVGPRTQGDFKAA